MVKSIDRFNHLTSFQYLQLAIKGITPSNQYHQNYSRFLRFVDYLIDKNAIFMIYFHR